MQKHPKDKFKFIAVLLALGLTGCTHIAISSFDKNQDTVTIQGGKWASQDDYQKKADEYCGHHATLLAMGQRQVGTYTQANVQSYGNSANGQATSTAINRYLYTFTCKQGQ